MTLPRLRVRELLFLVVYAALIGQAFVLSSVGASFQVSFSHPSHYRGYVWVWASEIPFHVRGPDGMYQYQATAGGVGGFWRSDLVYQDISVPFKAEMAERLGVSETELRDLLQVLVPEDRLEVTREDQE